MELRDGLKRSLESSVVRPPFELVEQRAEAIVRRRYSRRVVAVAGVAAAAVVFAAASLAPDGGAVPEIGDVTSAPALSGKDDAAVNVNYDWDLGTVEAGVQLAPRFRNTERMSVEVRLSQALKAGRRQAAYGAEFDLRNGGATYEVLAEPTGPPDPTMESCLMTVSVSADAAAAGVHAPLECLPAPRRPVAWSVDVVAYGGRADPPGPGTMKTYTFTSRPRTGHDR